ncbi:Uncharacterized protein FWK35_00023710, partial [Aphis craccivora]
AKDKNSKLTRWSLQLASLDFSTVHVPGIQNEAPDLLSRDPAPGPTIDEDRLEENLVGAPSTPKTDIDLESDRIFYMGNNHDSDNTPLTATTLGKWQSDDATIRDVIAGPHTPVVIPKTKIQHVIWRCHDHVLSNHSGWKKTYRAVRQRYYWKGQNNDVRLYVGACHVSACTKPLNSRPNDPMQPRTPRQPWEVISVDLMGPYLRSGTATSKTIIETLEREFFSRFDYPRVCLSDNGPQFVSNDMLNAYERRGTQDWTTPIYHPRANPVERRNQDLKKGLRAQLVDGEHKSWDTKLPTILFSIRNRCNEQTGYPPAVLVLGRECKRPGDWTLSKSTTVTIEKSQEERVVWEKHILGRKVVVKPSANTVTPVRFSKGDVVYYKAHHLSKAHKDFHAGFTPKWWGPVTLSKQVGKGVFLTDQQPPRKIHVSCLKRAPHNDITK